MKAIVSTKYGSPDVLQLLEVVKPAPEDNELLTKKLLRQLARQIPITGGRTPSSSAL